MQSLITLIKIFKLLLCSLLFPYISSTQQERMHDSWSYVACKQCMAKTTEKLITSKLYEAELYKHCLKDWQRAKVRQSGHVIGINCYAIFHE